MRPPTRPDPSRRDLLATGSLGIVTATLPAAAAATSVVTPASAPAAPTVTALPAGYLVDGESGTGQVEVSWVEVGGATSYLVRTSPAGAGTWSLGTSTTGTRLLVGGLAAGQFDVEVTASNGTGSSTPTVVEGVESVMATGGDAVATFLGDGAVGVAGIRYVVHRFTAVGPGSLTLRRARDLDCLVVGGGGGGGAGHAGGGGGGGGVVVGSITAATGTVSVSVGAAGGGGLGSGASGARRGGHGLASTLTATDGTTPTTITAGGGGGGAGFGAEGDAQFLDRAGDGSDGASGGGGNGDDLNDDATRSGGTATGGGYAGGAGSNPNAYGTAGGGGGAGGAGGSGTYNVAGASVGGAGGLGVVADITGAGVAYGAGGGGGGWGPKDPVWDGATDAGVGGAGGSSGAGGYGGPLTSGGDPITSPALLDFDTNLGRGRAATTPGSGGGGSAARPYSNARDGGAGAAGTVIVRYAVPA